MTLDKKKLQKVRKREKNIKNKNKANCRIEDCK